MSPLRGIDSTKDPVIHPPLTAHGNATMHSRAWFKHLMARCPEGWDMSLDPARLSLDLCHIGVTRWRYIWKIGTSTSNEECTSLAKLAICFTSGTADNWIMQYEMVRILYPLPFAFLQEEAHHKPLAPFFPLKKQGVSYGAVAVKSGAGWNSYGKPESKSPLKRPGLKHCTSNNTRN